MRQTIDAAAFQQMVIHAAAAIRAEKQRINDLNVFPVPDGDTGTNMSLSIGAAATEMKKQSFDTVGKAAQATASALLRGARGNSGVILSLLFRGFAKAIKERETMDGRDLAIALDFGVAAAYKAVMKPAEGTILTVSRLAAARAAGAAREDNCFETVLEAAIQEGQLALADTVNQNPVLKKAGVVDAGGAGFLLILQGMLNELRGEEMPAEEEPAQAEDLAAGRHVQSTDDLDAVEQELERGAAMPEEPVKAAPEKKYGYVAVCAGAGLEAVFKDLGVDGVISGGQTMNPSTEDILREIDRTPAEIVFVLPNNKNIIMAAEQCVRLCEDKKVVVLPSKTVPQGIAAMMAVDPEMEQGELTEMMTEALGRVRTAEITYAARDSDFGGFAIKEGDYLALLEHQLFGTDRDLDGLMDRLAKSDALQEAEFISLFYGEDVTEEQAGKAAERFTAACPNAEVSVMPGGQPVYYYMISAE